jgi:hypothetical protein
MRSKRVIPMLLLLLVAFSAPLFAADQWMLRRETSSGVCHVQKKTASSLGADLAGPFNTRKDACLKAKDLYDSDGTGGAMCSGYGQGTITGCKNESVTLPGEKSASAPKP